MSDVKRARQDFPIFKRKINGKPLIYLDSAATTQKPRQVIAAIKNFYERHNANIHRGIHTLSEEANLAYAQARTTVASFLGARAKELIFTRNATEAINLVAFSWGRKNLKKGDLILLTEMEHHSNIVPWQQLAKEKGCRLEYLKVGKDLVLDREDLEKKLLIKPKLVSLVHVSNVFGIINPVTEITKRSHQVGAKVLLDGAQSLPHLPVNVAKIGCDFFAFSGHKMLGPMGIGGLYIKEEILGGMEPFLTGGGMVSQVCKDGVTFAPGPERFEAGTPNVAGAIGLAAAVEYLQKIGLEKIYQHELALTEYLVKQLNGVDHLTVYGTNGEHNRYKRIGVVSFTLDGVHAHDVAQVLDQEGIAVRSGHHCAMILHTEVLKVPATVRASLYLYNNFTDVDRLVKALKKCKQYFT